jgi:predicted DNA-binding transcriptional regulator YafY
MGMAKYDRLLYILNLLRSRRNLNAGMIAEECGVTERTIYRDIVSLSEANIPIYYDNGYKYASGNFLPPLNFDVDEYITLKTALESSPLYKRGRSRKLIKSIKTKIEACLSPTVKKKKMFATGTTSIDIKSTLSDSCSERFYAAVEDGIRLHRTLKLEYNSIQSGIMEREVEPYFLIFIEKAFYFVGYCYLRGDLRTFRIDRIIDVILTDKKFIPRSDIDPARYFENSWGVFSGEPIDVEAIFTGKAARIVSMSKHHASEKVTSLEDGAVRYEVKVSGTEEICRWLLGFGGEVTVISPLSLISKMRRRAENILNNYE